MRLEEDDRPGHVWRCVPAVPSPAVARAAAAQSSGSHSDLFLPSSHPQHSTAQCAPQPVPWLEAGAAWGMRAISSNQTAGGEASTHPGPVQQLPGHPDTSDTSPHCSSPTHPGPWTQDTLCGPNLPSQQLQVTKHPRLVSCFSL